MKHSFLVQFLNTEETEAKAASKAAQRVRSVWARGLESVFGITAPDPKLGKEGSRVIHPQSAFATGMAAPLLYQWWPFVEKSWGRDEAWQCDPSRNG